jgi:hypothetical protein
MGNDYSKTGPGADDIVMGEGNDMITGKDDRDQIGRPDD